MEEARAATEGLSKVTAFHAMGVADIQKHKDSFAIIADFFMHDAGGSNHVGVGKGTVSRELVGSLQEGLQAVREKASFLEGELRGQLADARGALEAERAQRRAAEAALAQQLRQAQHETAAIQAGRASAREAQEQQQVRPPSLEPHISCCRWPPAAHLVKGMLLSWQLTRQRARF